MRLFRQCRQFVTKRQKLQFLLKKKPLVNVKDEKKVPRTDPIPEPIVERKGPRVFWYTDPYLLGSAISELFAHAEQKGVESTIVMVHDLLLRHTGAANTEVFGLVFKHLNTLKKYEKVFEFYNLLKQRELKLTNQGATVLLSALISLDQSILKKLEMAKEIFEQSEKQVIQVSVLLRFCSKAYTNQSFEYGMQAYQDFVKSGPETEDVQLYTGLVSLLAKKPTNSNVAMAKQIFTDMQTKNLVDEQLAAAYLNLLAKSFIPTAPTEALSIISKHFGFPKTHKQQPVALKKISTEFLTIMLYIAAKLKYPSLAQRWVELANVKMDTTCGMAFSDIYLQSGDCPKAWQLFEHYSKDNVNSLGVEFGLKICAMASTKKQRDKEWITRAEELIQKEPLTYRAMYNYLWTLVNYEQFDAGYEFISKHKTELLDDTLKEFEALLVSKAQAASLLRLKLSGVKLIRKILNAYQAGKEKDVAITLLENKVQSIESLQELQKQTREANGSLEGETETSSVTRKKPYKSDIKSKPKKESGQTKSWKKRHSKF